jgi:prepilin-type N-terminal cleavage/methylation domain-containing protein
MKKGFTLIELLIVIALLGTLAVALLAAIDPFEQFRKGTDTGTRNTVQEIYNAGIRYYSLKNEWPDDWTFANTAQPIVACDSEEDDNCTEDPLTSEVILDPLIAAGELKDNFVELAEGSLSKIFLSKRTAGTNDSHIAVCFKPESKSFQNADSNTKFVSPDYLATGAYQPQEDDPENPECKLNDPDEGEACYWCVY